jgi:ribonuclease III
MTFEELQKILGFTFKNQELMHSAFYHRSYLNEARHIKESNERLEFLGDAILSTLTSVFLYTTYPEYPEGTLTNIRSSLVNTKSLADAARSLHLGDLLFLSKGEEESGGRNNQSLLADSFEALLGAIFLENGLDEVRKFLNNALFPKTIEIIKTKSYIDFKSYLQEIIQDKTKISPVYNVTKSEGPDHDKTFWIDVKAGDTVLGSGMGKSKQLAEQAAARSALEKINHT